MEQSKFILEVQSRQCIWNPRAQSYLDRILKRRAWEEIAAKMYVGYDSCSENDKREKVTELQKKWKSLRDYYKRRNPNEDYDEKTKQKKPIVELLQFLDKVTKFNYEIRTQHRKAQQIKKRKNKNLIFELPDCKITVEKLNDNHSLKPRNTQINIRCPKASLDRNYQMNEQMKFLQSLLPVMQGLNDRQRFEFKLDVMMLIKKIKYESVEDTSSNIDYSSQQDKKLLNKRTPKYESLPWPMLSLG